MPRKYLIRSATLPYHVTARANNREPFHCGLTAAWDEFTHQALEITLLFGARIHAFVMMPNHIHLLVSTPEKDLGEVMQHYMRSATKTLNLKSGRSGHLFGGRYHWTLIDSVIYYAHALKYVYRNPVRARLCRVVQEYEFSTLQGLLGQAALTFPLYYPDDASRCELISADGSEQLRWLNEPFAKEHESAIQSALKRSTFAPPKNGWKRTIEELWDRPL